MELIWKRKLDGKKKKPIQFLYTIAGKQEVGTHTKKNWPLRTSVEDKEIGSESLTEILPASCNPSIQIQCV